MTESRTQKDPEGIPWGKDREPFYEQGNECSLSVFQREQVGSSWSLGLLHPYISWRSLGLYWTIFGSPGNCHGEERCDIYCINGCKMYFGVKCESAYLPYWNWPVWPACYLCPCSTHPRRAAYTECVEYKQAIGQSPLRLPAHVWLSTYSHTRACRH